MVNLVKHDLEFILKQIKISEAHAEGTPLTDLVDSPLLPYGLRTVDGSYNNLVPGREKWGAADESFLQITEPSYQNEGDDTFPYVPSGNNDYGTSGDLVDADPRLISNLIVDQTSNNPIATQLYERFLEEGLNVSATPLFEEDGVTPKLASDGSHLVSYTFDNISPDIGDSAPYSAMFTLFGQFFDHGLDHVAKGGNGTVYMPLSPDDPLYDPASPHTNFMALTRASTGEDGKNTTTPWVDQNQTYGSHASLNVFLREYVAGPDGRPMATGHLLEGSNGGMATWADVKKQAADILGIKLTDLDVDKVPLVAADPYGNFIPGDNGFPRLVVGLGPDGEFGTADDELVEGNPAEPVDPSLAGAFRTGHAFLLDIAHNAAPVAADGVLIQDTDDVAGNAVAVNNRGQNTEYDDELLDAHFIAGDGRANENIGLTAIHHVFHSEHNRVVDHAKDVILSSGDVDFINEWLLTPVDAVPTTQAEIDALNWNGERIFQVGRFTTEMEYQHLVFEEFARKMQPDVDAFLFEPDPDINPAIFAEFANVIYRFGHSMLNETVDRVNADGSHADLTLFEAFLNPIAYDNASSITHDQAAGAIIRGMSGQVGNEIDEFVTDVLRNQLTGIPLDLAAINIARGRDTGMPTLNEARSQFKDMAGGDSQLDPYVSWTDFALNMKNPESIVNFIAAYGTHDLVTEQTTLEGKRAAAMAIVFGQPQFIYGDPDDPTDDAFAMVPADRLDFLNGTGNYAEDLGGLNNVDLWIGGLAEKKMDFGGMLGSTFSFIFELQMENLQDGDRFYYLSRVQGLNLLSELESNSLAKMVLRNTDIGETGSAVPGDIFSRPDLTLYMDLAKQIEMTGEDDPEHENETLEALSNMVERRDEDGDGVAEYIRYNGGDHTVIQGSDGDDHIVAGEGDDSIWGGDGDDRLEGGYGVDHVHGGAGDDIITNAGTDIGAADFLHGDEGDDVIQGGSGLSLIFGNQGRDFLIAGPDGKTVMGGIGDDFILGGDGMDFLLGEAGDDWMEGGGRFDTLAGENSELFFNSTIIGHDVLNGQQGDVDYDAESGDDIMLQGVGIQRNNGMAGFDWAIHKGDSAAANSDLGIGIFQNQEEFILRDRFDLVEGLSGWKYNDVLTGRAVAQGARDEVIGTAAIPAPDDPFYSWSNALTESGVARIDGLRELLGHLTWDESDPDAIVMETGDASDILLGGDGNDTFEGKGGNDIIDGDAWFNVRISVRDADGNEIATADGLTEPLYKSAEGLLAKDPDDLYLSADGAVVTLENAMLDGTFKPGQLQIVREILHADGSDDTDTAIFAGNRDWYEITHVGEKVFVARREDELIDPRIDEGSDVLINIERIQFSDGVYTIRETGNVGPTGRLVIEGLPATEDQPLKVSAAEVRDENNPGGTVTNITYRWQVERNDGTGDYEDVDGVTGDTFTPGDEHAGLRIRVIGTYIDAGGVPETVFSAPTDGVVSVNDEPTGLLLISDMTPTEGQELTATVAFTDPDGTSDAFEEALMTYQWQFFDGTAWQNIPAEEGGQSRSFTPGSAQVGLTMRIQVTYTDDQANVHTVTSATTQIVGNHIESDAAVINAGNGDAEGGVTTGDDIVNGGAGDNAIAGAAGNDVINGGAGNDTINGRAGNDTLSGGAGDDTVYGDAGDDTIVYAGTDGNDAIYGGAGEDTLKIVEGNADADETVQVELDGGAITRAGGATIASIERVEIDLGSGSDTLDYSGSTDAVEVDLLTGKASGFTFVRNLENVIGGSGDDTLLGNNADNRLAGALGNDTLRGGFGNDTLEGSAGADLLYGEAGDDTLVGGEGDDRIDGGEGSDTASYAGAAAAVAVSLAIAGPQDTLGAGSDMLVGIENLDGSAHDDTLSGNAGDNVIDGSAGADTMEGGAGNDTYVVQDAGDLAIEGADGGNDTIRSSLTTYQLAGNVENLVLEGAAIEGIGNQLDNRLTGNAGNNTLRGAGGTDTVVLDGTLTDYAFGADGGVTVTSANGGTDTLINIERAELEGVAYDIVRGNHGANTDLAGTDSADLVLGFNNDDTLSGNGGNDILIGGNGNDSMLGGDGDDTYIVEDNGDVVDETGSSGNDTVLSSINFNLSDAGRVVGEVENLTLTGSAVTGRGNELDNTVTGNGEGNALFGNQGNDHLIGNAGEDTLRGGIGDDVLEGGAGNDTLFGGGGTDTAVFSGPASNYRFGFSGTTIVSVTDIVGDGGTDTLDNFERLRFGDQEVAIVSGTAGADGEISSPGAAVLFGLDGNDTIAGSDGDDIIIGGAGDDTLFGHGGIDGDNAVNGPADDDTFIYYAGDGLDTINGGTEGEGGDTFQLVGNDENETFRFYTYDEAAALIGYAGSDENEIIVTRQVDGGDEVIIAELAEIEEIVVNNGSGDDTVQMIGNFEVTTSLWPNTVTIVGSSGNDTVDISSLLSAHRIVFKTKGGNDTIIGTLRPQDVVELEAGKTIDDYVTTANEDGSTTIASETHSVTFFSTGGLPQFAAGEGNAGGEEAGGEETGGEEAGNDGEETVGPDAEDDDDGHNVTPGLSGTIIGTSEADALVGTADGETVMGLAGRDVIFAGDGSDNVMGGGEADMLYGDGGADRILGGDGDDFVNAGAGNDTVFGGDGDDLIVAQAGDGNDTYYGDDMVGGDGNDTLDMSAIMADMSADLGTGFMGRGSVSSADTGNDTLWGVENIVAGSGDDVITASGAANVMDGGAGNDIFRFLSAADADGDTIMGFQPGDRIDLSGMDANGCAPGKQSFTLVSDAFTGKGQLMVTTETRDGEDFTVVQGSTTGDDGADFKFSIKGSHDLTASDFTL